jgi:hypothetical protein
MAGLEGSNACPPGYARIETEAVCNGAGGERNSIRGTPFVYNDPVWPGGCWGFGTATPNEYYMHFNTATPGLDLTGSHMFLWCIIATTGAPPPRRCARACAPALAAALRMSSDARVYVRDCVCVVAVRRRHVGANALCGLCGAAATAGRCGTGTGSVCARRVGPEYSRVLRSTRGRHVYTTDGL